MVELALLSDIAKYQPQAAYAAFMHGFVHKFSYVCRAVPNIDPLLQPLEDCMTALILQQFPEYPLEYLERQVRAKR